MSISTLLALTLHQATANHHCISIHRSDGKEFLGSLYQKINKNLDGAISVSCTTGNSTPIFSLGGLYRMDEETQIKVSTGCNLFLLITFFTPTFCLSHRFICFTTRRLASTTRT